MTVDPSQLTMTAFYKLISGVVNPRPIALVSSCDETGLVNLAPYSFFNVVSVVPPILVFSPLSGGEGKPSKDTLKNAAQQKEVVVNIIDHEQAGKMSLAGGAYGPEVNEFHKAGFSSKSSVKVRPPRVKEAIASFECKVTEILTFGKQSGAGNLVFCEVVMAHFSSRILNEKNDVDPNSYQAVGRLGGSYYIKGDGRALFEIPKDSNGKGVGWDELPEFIRTSKFLTGNEISALAAIQSLPELDKSVSIQGQTEEQVYEKIKHCIAESKLKDAWQFVLAFNKQADQSS